jgi:hypothetical protein
MQEEFNMSEIDKKKKFIYIAIASTVVAFALFIGIMMHVDYKATVERRMLPGLELMSSQQREEFRKLEREVNNILISKMTAEEVDAFIKATSGGTVTSPEQARKAAGIMQNVMQRLSDEEREKVQKFQDQVNSLRQ